jgi:hypothetical protein
MRLAGQGDLPERLREIATFDHASCLAVWPDVFDTQPPKRLRAETLRQLLAYELQSRALGGLTAQERRSLRSIAAGKSPDMAIVRAGVTGTHLVREWNGRTYRVEVTDEGYLMDGKVHASLTAIAKRITGTAWSGPRFFGLTPKRST